MPNPLEFLEARAGFEPANDGFADHSLRPLGYRASAYALTEGCKIPPRGFEKTTGVCPKSMPNSMPNAPYFRLFTPFTFFVNY